MAALLEDVMESSQVATALRQRVIMLEPDHLFKNGSLRRFPEHRPPRSHAGIGMSLTPVAGDHSTTRARSRRSRFLGAVTNNLRRPNVGNSRCHAATVMD